MKIFYRQKCDQIFVDIFSGNSTISSSLTKLKIWKMLESFFKNVTSCNIVKDGYKINAILSPLDI